MKVNTLYLVFLTTLGQREGGFSKLLIFKYRTSLITALRLPHRDLNQPPKDFWEEIQLD